MTEAASDPDPVYDRHGISVHHGSALSALSRLPDCSVEAVISDPPYGLEFMGREWDTFKTGGKQSGFGKPDGSKFRQNMGTPSFGASGNPTCRNCGGDRYRNGPRKCSCDRPDFPNHMAPQMRAFQRWCEEWATECLRVLKPGGHLAVFGGTRTFHRLTCGVEDAGFEIRDSIGVAGWVYGSGFPKSKAHLKPAWEPIILARKPLIGTVAQTVSQHGTGAMNIDACRTGADTARIRTRSASSDLGTMNDDGWTPKSVDQRSYPDGAGGRWPTNVLLTHHPDCGTDAEPRPCVPDCHVAELDRQSGTLTSGANPTRRGSDKFRDAYGEFRGQTECTPARGADSGGASRFFPSFRWEAKAPTSERPQVNGVTHPTVKPVALMRWLVRLLVRPGGLIVDMFAGTGPTGQAARAEGVRAILIEREADYIPLIKARLDARERTPAASTGVVSGDEPMDLLDLLKDEAS